MKRAPVLLAVGVEAAAGVYTIIYLYRWEWNRAIICALFFVATEVVVVTIAVLGRLRRLDERLSDLDEALRASQAEAVLGRLREHAPEARDHFRWLKDSTTRTNVLLPVLLGAGVLASGAAWVVEHLARAATVPVLERRLAERLAVISVPPVGLLAAVPYELSAVRRPRRRWLVSGALLVAGATLAGFTLDFVADRIQTRADVQVADVETVIDLRLRGETALEDPQRAVAHLWAVCTSTNVFRQSRIPEPRVSHSPGGDVVVVVPIDLGEHGTDRLVGCLNDATLDKVQARVVAVTTT